jgi:PAS domain S-box-containing protein
MSKMEFDYPETGRSQGRLDGRNLLFQQPVGLKATGPESPFQRMLPKPFESPGKSLIWPTTTAIAAANNIIDAIVITDLTGRITLVNSAALKIFSMTEFAIQGKTCDLLLAEGQNCPHRELTSDHRLVARELLSRVGDLLLEVNASGFEDTDGRLCGFVHTIRVLASARAVSHDTTSKKTGERPPVQSERLSLASLMVSVIAHEVATPLSIIANIAEMLLQDFERESQAGGELKKIVTQARRITEMTRQMLGFLRDQPTQLAAVDMAELARETLDLVASECRAARIQLSVDNKLDTPPIRGDRAQLQQVLLNLVFNAIHAMKTDGRLHMRIAEEAGPAIRQQTVLLTVEDTGPGIPAHALEKLFDFFFTTRKAEGGTGLGLAICKQIVNRHGGTIKAESPHSGGARFSVRLPAFT